MQILEITTIKPKQATKPLTPQQARVSALKQQKERASDMLKAEKDRQKQEKALVGIQKNNQILANLNN